MSESIEINDYDDDCSDTSKSDFVKVSGNILSNINYKLSFFVFILGVILFSDVFIENVLAGFTGTVDGECTTTKGTILQLLMLCLGLIVLDLLIKYEWL